MWENIVTATLIWLLALLQLDDRYILQTSCNLPCWNEIIPNGANDIEVKTNLHKLPIYKMAFIYREFKHQDGSISYAWWDKYIQEASSIKIYNDNVVLITLQSYLPTTLEGFMSVFGEPDGTRTRQSIDWRTETVTVSLEAFYPKLGLVSVFVDEIHSIQSIESYVISPTMLADKYYLYSSSNTLLDFAHHLSIVRGSSSDPKEYIKTITFWEGLNSSVPVYH